MGLYILSQHRLYISFSLYRSLISPYLSHGLVAWRQPANSHLHKLLVLQKRILRLICFSKTKEHAVPLFISSNLLPLHMLYFETVSTLMHGYKTRSSNSGNFFINILKRINNFIDLFSFASLENNTYIHKIIRQGDHYSLANNSRSQVKKNINK